jgi:tetratricopeptide (TPR) repeat protein
MEPLRRAEPVAALASPIELSLKDRILRIVERAVEAFLVNDQNGAYAVRRIARIVNKQDFQRALGVIRALAEEHDLAPGPYAWASAFEGWCLLALGDAHSAAAAARKVPLEDLPKRAHPIVLSVLFADARLRGDSEAMLRSARALHDIAPSHESEFQLAIAEKNAGQLDAAIARLDSIIEKAPKNAIMILALAGYRVLRGDTDAREEMYSVLNDSSLDRGKELWWQANRMWACGVLDDEQGATEALLKVIALTPAKEKPGMIIYIESEADLRNFRERAQFSDVFEKWRRE